MDISNLTYQEVESYFAQTYHKHHQLNDVAHREDHFREVFRLAKEINEELDLRQNPKLIMIVAWTHDLFAWERRTHHDLSAKWIMDTEDPLINGLTRDHRLTISKACLEHRASYSGGFSSTLSELMSSADRGVPDPGQQLFRAFNYALFKEDKGVTASVTTAVRHVINKYGRDGYQRLPELYKHYFQEKLEEQYQAIERYTEMTYEELKEVLTQAKLTKMYPVEDRLAAV